MSWLRIRELVRKEFIQLLRDKRNRTPDETALLLTLLAQATADAAEVSPTRKYVLATGGEPATEAERDYLAARRRQHPRGLRRVGVEPPHRVRPLAGREPNVRASLQALGLGRIGKQREFQVNPAIMGALKKLHHLVKVEEIK